MKKSIFIFIFFGLFAGISFAGEHTFTEDDLLRYQYGSSPAETPNEKKAPDISDNSNKTEAVVWCDRMTAAKDRLKRAQKALIDAGMTEAGVRTTYGRRYIGGQAVTEAQIEENKAKDEVRAAQDDLKNIEDEAHRKGIPPGWLYCNY